MKESNILKIEVYDSVEVQDVVIGVQTFNHEAPVVKFAMFGGEEVFVSPLSTWAGVQIRAPGYFTGVISNLNPSGFIR